MYAAVAHLEVAQLAGGGGPVRPSFGEDEEEAARRQQLTHGHDGLPHPGSVQGLGPIAGRPLDDRRITVNRAAMML